MDNFPTIWMTDICNELNRSGFEMVDYKGGGKFDVSRLDNSIDLMKSYVTYSASMYEHLNSKGLVNRGRCPITGQEIGTSYFYEIFGRKVYLSEEGKKIAKEWDRAEFIKTFGKEPPTDEQKLKAYEDFKQQRPKTPLVFWLLLIVVVIYIIKKCM